MVLLPRQRLLIAVLNHRRGRGRIDLGRVQLGMPEELLNLLKRHPVFEKGGGNGVPQNMGRDPFGNPCQRSSFLHQLLDTPR